MNFKHIQKGFSFVELLVVLAVVASVGAGGWYVWQANLPQQPHDTVASANTFKIAPLGIEFDIKGDITPLYSIQGINEQGRNTKLIYLSTQQLVDAGKSNANSACGFNAQNWDSNSHALMYINIFNSKEEAWQARGRANLTIAEMTPQNGYITINDKIYVVPDGAQRGAGPCGAVGVGKNSIDFEDSQRAFLRDSLMTLRASK